MIYMDYSATSPVYLEVARLMNEIQRNCFGNASTLYRIGVKSQELIEDAREKIAEIINADPGEICFTSGGSEGNNMIMNMYERRVVSSFEHDSVLKSGAIKPTLISPDKNGFVFPEEMVSVARDEGAELISLMMVNNEIGTIQDVAKLQGNGIVVHTDAVQAMGHIPIDVKALGINYLTASAHKFGGPKGVGFVYIKNGGHAAPLICGGGQENGRRAGTENVAGICGMAKALEISTSEDSSKIKKLRDDLWGEISQIDGVRLNGSMDNRIYSNLNISIEGVDAQTLIILLSEFDIYISAGSACSSGSPIPSHVLKSIGLGDQMANSSIRITLGRTNTDDDIKNFADILKYQVDRLRGR